MLISHAKRQQGVSLIELMVAMVVGLLVVLAATSVYLTAVRGSSDNLRSARLNIEMRGLMALVAAEIRRAGYYSNLNEPRNNPYTQAATNLRVVGVSAGETVVGNCILYSYQSTATVPAPAPAGTPPTQDFFGFKILNNALHMRSGGTAPSTSGSCAESGDNWEVVSDTGNVRLTNLQFTVSYECTNSSIFPVTSGGTACATGKTTYDGAAADAVLVEAREVHIVMTGVHAQDLNLTMTLDQRIKVRNDRVEVK